MDVDDMEIDLDLGPEVDQVEVMTDQIAQEPLEMDAAPPIEIPAAYLPGDVGLDKNKAQSNKVYIYGLESFTTEMVESFAREHYPSEAFQRIEWIDDASGNIVYTNPTAAAEALASFARDEQEQTRPVSELRAAKHLSSHPRLELQVRQSIVADRKKRGAHEASRFYLLNPDQNPHENGTFDKSRRHRGRDERGDYKRRRFDDQENQRRQNGEQFNVDMYDDNAGAEGSLSDTGERRQRRNRGRRGDDDLFGAGAAKGRLRNRSASPLRDGDGRLGFAEDQPRRQTARHRSTTPPRLRQYAQPRELFADSSTRPELFPAAMSADHDTNGPVKELFPTHTTPMRPMNGALPHKKSLSNHRRTPAFDAKDETTYERFSPKPRSLAERITGGPPVRSGPATQGFSFKGASRNAQDVVKELFPEKTGNEGKELFGEKIKGRGGQRRRAEDMF